MASQTNNFIVNLVFDPNSHFIVRWNNCMFIVGLINFYVDPMFMYLPIFNYSKTAIDVHIGSILATVRTIGDLIRLLDIIIKFRTAYEAPGFRVFKRRRLVIEPGDISINYFKSTFHSRLYSCITIASAKDPHPLLYIKGGIQSMEEREEQQRSRKREIQEWLDYHQLQPNLRIRVDLAIQSEWTENGIDDEVMLDSLPMDLRSEIRKYLYMDSVSKFPKFANMDIPLLEAICQHIKTFSGKEGTYIVYEGDILKQMIFIFSGELELSFTDKGNSSFTILGPGESCGQELVTWASQPTTSMDSLPSSTWTIKCLTDVEAFVLQAYDMKILATQFAHNQEFQRAFKQHYP